MPDNTVRIGKYRFWIVSRRGEYPDSDFDH